MKNKWWLPQLFLFRTKNIKLDICIMYISAALLFLVSILVDGNGEILSYFSEDFSYLIMWSIFGFVIYSSIIVIIHSKPDTVGILYKQHKVMAIVFILIYMLLIIMPLLYELFRAI